MNDKYEVPESRIEELEAKIAKLNRKAAKLGCDPITITISEETKQVERTRAIIDCDDTAFRTEIVTAREVTVEGEAPKLNGWNVIASIDYVGGEPIFHKLSDEELPLRFRTQGAICEHCASNRFRKYVYALKSGADEWKQVGSTCLKDFTGHSNPHGIASYLQWLRDIIVFMEDTESYGQGDVRELLTRFLTAACAVVRIDGGYVSR
ncbi:MAG: hypothetical protein KJ995_07915, partial [Candidatus Omnitrophica bacterium]|nr:hypothetical protein [Candidatus Omnitrophota bacterium]MBU1852311.1 hypothetical protein [Candidatus Omnitrophota bacterium]